MRSEKFLTITAVVLAGLSMCCAGMSLANSGDQTAQSMPAASPTAMSNADARNMADSTMPAPAQVASGSTPAGIMLPTGSMVVVDESGQQIQLGEPGEPRDGGPRDDCDGDLNMGGEASTIEAYPLSGFIYPAGSNFHARSMSLIRRSELACNPTIITQISIDIASAKTLNFNNVEIRMKKVTTTAFTSPTTIWDGSGDLVWGPNNGVQMTPTGWKTFVLHTPFVWDSDNLLITWQGQGTNGGGTNYPTYWRDVNLGWYSQCFSNGSSGYNNNMTPYQARARYQLTISTSGACCTDVSCQYTTPENCAAVGGVFRGYGVSCTPNPCGGACCYPDGNCVEVPGAGSCGGVYHGDGTTCPDNCPQPGACCAIDGGCYLSSMIAPGNCAGDDTYLGDNTTCWPNPCPQPGACCFSDQWCESLPRAQCAAYGGFHRGEGTTCPEACSALCMHQICLTDIYGDGWTGGKVTVYVNDIVALADITLANGFGPQCFAFLAGPGDTVFAHFTAGAWPEDDGYKVYDAAGMVICEGHAAQSGGPGDCVATGDCSLPVLGACCLRAGGCSLMLPAECTAANGTYNGPGSACDSDPCPVYQACPTQGTQWGQYPDLPNELWAFGTSDTVPGYSRAESYQTGGGTICGVDWWGLTLFYDPYYGWLDCQSEVPMTFAITFYRDNYGLPDAVVATYTVDVAGISTGLMYNDSPMLYFSTALDPCVIQSAGWIGIQATSVSSPDCWFLWAGSPAGDYASAFNDGSGWGINTDYYFQSDIAVCLTGSGGACSVLGDMNNDGAIDGDDIQGFVNCALGGGGNCACGDFDGNGSVDEQDVLPFVSFLVP
jgi:hypothetical protein